MKKILLLITYNLLLITAYSQRPYQIVADSILLYSNTANGAALKINTGTIIGKTSVKFEGIGVGASTDSVVTITSTGVLRKRNTTSFGSTYTSSNGITLSSLNFKLGGRLIENTTLTGTNNTYGLTLDSLSSFSANTSSGGITFKQNGRSKAQIGDSTLKLVEPQITTGDSVVAFSTSFGEGYDASVIDSSYLNMIAATKLYKLLNKAKSGAGVADQADSIYLQNPTPGKNYIYDISVNDQFQYNAGFGFKYFKRGWEEQVAWLGISDSNKRIANTAKWTYTGSWSSPSFYNGITKRSTSAGATATCTVFGSSVLISTVVENSNTGSFQVKIDGNVVDTFTNIAATGVITSYLGATKIPYLLHYDGLVDSIHTILITVLSGTGYSYINWAYGNRGNLLTYKEPAVFVTGAVRKAPQFYAVYGGNDSTVYAYNRAMDSSANYLASVGVNVIMTQAALSLNPLTDLTQALGLHPNNSGHKKLASGLLNVMNGIIYPVDRQRARNNMYNNGILMPTTAGISGWALTGNTAIDSTTNFIGTTDQKPFTIKTNNLTRATVSSTGNVGIGTTTPAKQLDVVGRMNLLDANNNSFILGGNTTGSGGYNYVFGNNSLIANTTGQYNTAIGLNTLTSNLTGSYNVAIGGAALFANTSGQLNTAIGLNALTTNLTGINNHAIGHEALYLNSSGDYNIAIGKQALRSNTSASHNFAAGYQAMYFNLTGAHNQAIGYRALYSNTSGTYNTAIGYQSGYFTTTGVSNVSIGVSSFEQNTVGQANLALGINALQRAVSDSLNVAIGPSAFPYHNGGNDNVVIGPYAMYEHTTGSGNIALGSNAGRFYTTMSNRLFIGAGDSLTASIYGDYTAGRTKLSLNAAKVHMPNLTAAAGTKALRYNTSTGLITYADTSAGGSSQWTTTGSDIYYNTGGVAVGNTSVAASSILDLTSTTKGALMPRMTTTQQNAISSPATGLEIFNTTLAEKMIYDGTRWVHASHPKYEVYSANLTQSGKSAPTATVLENTLGGTLTWSYYTSGIYDGVLTGAFTTASKVWKSIQYVGVNGGGITVKRFDADTIKVVDINGDYGLANTSIEIRVYY